MRPMPGYVDGCWSVGNYRYLHNASHRGAGSCRFLGHRLSKWLNVPYDSGVARARRRLTPCERCRLLRVSTDHQSVSKPLRLYAGTFKTGAGRGSMGRTRSLGRGGIAELVERSCNQARNFAKVAASRRIEVLNDVVLNQVLVAFGDAETTNRVISDLRQRNMLVWQYGLARANRDANQCLVVGNHRRGHNARVWTRCRIAQKYCS